MKNILILGAGRSTPVLISYLLSRSKKYDWFLTVGDFAVESANSLVADSDNSRSIFFDVTNEKQRRDEISRADIVVSMLPASMHVMVARDCIEFSTHFVSASYVSDDMMSLDNEAKDKGVLLLNEIGLDPGIDHMSAMKVIDNIRDAGGRLTSFKSYCGGLVHPDYDKNPWNYKFTWNPRNVVLAGQGTARYIKNKKYKYIPYHKLFERIDDIVVLDAGKFEGYANRDSLMYIESYGLNNIDTILRGTLRRKGFCKSWNMFVQLGMTDDSYVIRKSNDMTYREFTNLFFPYNDKLSVEEKFCNYIGLSDESKEFKKVEWLGIFKEEKIEIVDATPAQVLEKILKSKWSLDIKDKDMVVMQHQFEYNVNGVDQTLHSSLLVFGEGNTNTAMAKTVGLPVAIATKLILNGDIMQRGVVIPTSSEIYDQVLPELEEFGILFIDELINTH